MTYETIEEAYYFVSDAPPYEHTAVVHRTTGKAFFASEMADYDEIPEEAEGSDEYLWIPHKNDLNLGKAAGDGFYPQPLPGPVRSGPGYFPAQGGVRPLQGPVRAKRSPGGMVRLRGGKDP